MEAIALHLVSLSHVNFRSSDTSDKECLRVGDYWRQPANVQVTSVNFFNVVTQISGPSIVLLSASCVPHQLVNQSTAMDVSPARGVDFNGCIEVRQRQFRFSTEQVSVGAGEVGYGVVRTEIQYLATVRDRLFVICLGKVGVPTKPVGKRVSGVKPKRSVVIGDFPVRLTLTTICCSPAQVGRRTLGVET